MRSSWISLLILAAGLAACDRSVGRLPQGGIPALDGVYAGQAVLTQGRPRCAQRAPASITVRNGTVQGEIRSLVEPRASGGRFDAYIDQEGRVVTSARLAGEDILIEGFFHLDGFYGFAKSNDCSSRLELTKRPGA